MLQAQRSLSLSQKDRDMFVGIFFGHPASASVPYAAKSPLTTRAVNNYLAPSPI